MLGHRWTSIAGLVTLMVLVAFIAASADDLRYFGLVPPTDEPEIFAPGVVSRVGGRFWESDLSFWPDGLRCIFTRFGPGIPDFTVFESRLVDEAWTDPVPTTLFGGTSAIKPGLAPDGAKLFFAPPLSAGQLAAHETHMIHVIERQGDGWSEPRELFRGLYPSITLSGTIYYSGTIGGRDHIVYREFVDGEYTSQQLVGRPVYSVYEDIHPCIAPDEAYLIFDSRDRPREGECWLFVVFRTEDGSWTDPISLGGVLGHRSASMARISADGEALFFVSEGDIYWVDASILDAYRPPAH